MMSTTTAPTDTDSDDLMVVLRMVAAMASGRIERSPADAGTHRSLERLLDVVDEHAAGGTYTDSPDVVARAAKLAATKIAAMPPELARDALTIVKRALRLHEDMRALVADLRVTDALLRGHFGLLDERDGEDIYSSEWYELTGMEVVSDLLLSAAGMACEPYGSVPNDPMSASSAGGAAAWVLHGSVADVAERVAPRCG